MVHLLLKKEPQMNFTQIGGADIADRPSSTRTFFLSLSRDSSQSTLFMGMAVDPYKVHRIAAVSTMPFKIMSRSPKVAQAAAAAVAMSIPFQHSFRQTDRQSERPTDRATDCIRICSRKARPFGGGRLNCSLHTQYPHKYLSTPAREFISPFPAF